MFFLRFPYELAAFFAQFSLPRLPLRHLHAWQLSVTLRGPARVASGREGGGLHGQLGQGDLFCGDPVPMELLCTVYFPT